MKNLHIKPTETSPEILLDAKQAKFLIRGNSRPEDVRELYYPVVEWLGSFREELTGNNHKGYTDENPLIFEFDLAYFNSSTAKFLYDIIYECRIMKEAGIPIAVTWHYEEEDIDMKEAGEDLSYLAEIDFTYISK